MLKDLLYTATWETGDTMGAFLLAAGASVALWALWTSREGRK